MATPGHRSQCEPVLNVAVARRVTVWKRSASAYSLKRARTRATANSVRIAVRSRYSMRATPLIAKLTRTGPAAPRRAVTVSASPTHTRTADRRLLTRSCSGIRYARLQRVASGVVDSCRESCLASGGASSDQFNAGAESPRPADAARVGVALSRPCAVLENASYREAARQQ